MKRNGRVLKCVLGALMGALLVVSLSSCGTSTATFTLRGGMAIPSERSLSLFTVLDVPEPTGTPTSMKVQLYGVWLSSNADCSAPVLVSGDVAAEEQDMLESPTLFQGTPADGTYPCMILKLRDTMKFVPDATAVGAFTECVENTEYTFDIYRADDSGWKDLDGNDVVGTGSVASPGADEVYIFATTESSIAAAHAHQTITLLSPLTVPGEMTMYVDFTNKVTVNDGHCWLDPATIAFR